MQRLYESLELITIILVQAYRLMTEFLLELFSTYTLTDDEYESCTRFAAESDQTFYAKRSQGNREKAKLDATVGKAGEIVVARRLSPVLGGMEPDFGIYGPNEKTWDSDLSVGDTEIHVKTQERNQSERYGLSWIFQCGRGGTDKSIFSPEENSLVVFVMVELATRKGRIKAILENEDILRLKLFKDPMNDYLRDTKRCVYYRDIRKYGLNHVVPKLFSHMLAKGT